MKTIWKFPFPVQDQFQLAMPAGAEVLAVQVQNDKPCVWALVGESKPTTARTFRVIGTGHRLPDNEILRYLGTFQLDNGAFVGHLFEVES